MPSQEASARESLRRKDLPMSYYAEHASEYIASTIGTDMSYAYTMFEPLLPKGGSILDVGFGSGRDMLHFKSKGFDVHGIDIEPKFVEHAQPLGLNVEIGDVLRYSSDKKYDGIWACASLLHLPLKDVRPAIDHLLSFLHEDGVLFISMKEGSFEGIDDRGRPMLMVNEDIFKGYHVISLKKTLEAGRGLTWINVILRR